MNKKLKVAILGIAHIHAHCLYNVFKAHPDKYEILGCADVPVYHAEPEKLYDLNFPQEDKPKLFADYKELLALKPDVAVITSDIRSHTEIVEETLALGIHTVVEKPMAIDMENAKRMFRAYKKSDAVLCINWPVAWFESFKKAYEVLKSGIVGEPYRFHYRCPSTFGPYPKDKYTPAEMSQMWWYKHEFGGGSIMDYCGYGCMLATWFLGKTARKVSGFKRNYNLQFSDVEDYAVFNLDFGKQIATIEGSWSTYSNGQIPTGPVIYGEKGVIVADRYTDVIKVYTTHVPYVPTGEPEYVYDFADKKPTDVAEVLYKNLIDNEPLPETITAEFNMKVMAALDAGIRACETEQVVAVDSEIRE